MADTEKILHTEYNYKAKQGGGYIKLYFENDTTDVKIPDVNQEKCYGAVNLNQFIDQVVSKIAGLNPLTVIRSSFQYDPDELFTRPGQLLYEFNTGRCKVADGIRTFKHLPYLCDEKSGTEEDTDSSYHLCETDAGIADKTVPFDGFTLGNKTQVIVRFTEENTEPNPTLNVNNTGAYPITKDGAPITPGSLHANVSYIFEFDGTSYELIGIVSSDGSIIYGNGYDEEYVSSENQKIPAYLDGLVYAEGEDLPLDFSIDGLEVLSSPPTDGRSAYVVEVS